MPPRKMAVIACGVLAWNVRRVADRLDLSALQIEILPGGLHRNPRRLRELLQERIDALSEEPSLTGIALGYGVCGRATVGLHARRLPVLIPRTQDCIGIFLGSHHRYLQEFSRRPGTRYMSRGWYDSQQHAAADSPTGAGEGEEQAGEARERSLYGPEFQTLAERYGTENARYICEFRTSWQKNYQRAAYIRYPGEDVSPPGERVTVATAESLGWEHETLEGDESLLEALLAGHGDDPRILEVPPHARTVSAPGGTVISYTSGLDADAADRLDAFRSRHGQPAVARTGTGLGIDTGGTFTDAAVYDFDANRVLAWAKAPTDHSNLVRGIRAALADLPAERLRAVSRIGISTTLATNAFVENKGRPVALLIMAPWPLDTADFPFRFVRQIQGRCTMDGTETVAVDPDEVARIAGEAAQAGCQAFAVSGFASVVNPAHERRVADLACETTGLHAVCGHELTRRLNFRERATTAAMNARLVPLVEDLLDAIHKALGEVGLAEHSVMVVKGDGSQMLDSVARMLPVETLLSGPAASVVGASTLVRSSDAVVADIGGTTLDVASLRGGIPVRSDRGARVGDFQTSVDAMAVRTIGLGGDSEIDLSDWPRVRIGPRRITPVCRMTLGHPETTQTLCELRNRYLPKERNGVDFVSRCTEETQGNGLLEALGETPRLLAEVANDLGCPAPRFLDWELFETEGKIRRYGLTPTDILHVQGEYDAFDAAAAKHVFDAWVALLDVDPTDILDAIHAEFRRMVCVEVLGVALPDDCPWDDEKAGLRDWLCRHVSGEQENSNGAHLVCRLGMPLVGVGAPAAALFPQMRETFEQDVLLPEHAGVANAVGAVAGEVMLRQEARIQINSEGVFVCSWRGGNERTADIERALTVCCEGMKRELRSDVEANDLEWAEPVVTINERSASTRDGVILLGVDMEAELRGG